MNEELAELRSRAAARRSRACATRRTARRDQLPFARGPHRQALLRARVAAVRRRPAARARCRSRDRRAAGAAARARSDARSSRRRRGDRRNPRARSAMLRVAERTGAPLPAGLAARYARRERGMTRLNLVLLAVLVGCALSLVTSRHQARKLFVELEREQARARALRDRVRPAAARAVDVVDAGARREGRARAAAHAAAAGPGRVEIVDVRREAAAMTAATAPRRGRAGRAPDAAAACARRSCSAVLALLFAVLAGRSLYLQWIDNEFLQEQGARALLARARGARASRPHRRSPRRGARDLDAGQVAVGVSRTSSRRRRTQLAQLARCSRRRRRRCKARSTRPTTSSSSRSRSRRRRPSARWRCASRGCTTRTSTAATTPAAR